MGLKQCSSHFTARLVKLISRETWSQTLTGLKALSWIQFSFCWD